MKIDARITNLGKLKDGLIKIRPITLLTGPNGTGKSFVTKSLYSIFNVVNRNVYHVDLIASIALCRVQLDVFMSQLAYPGQQDHQKIDHIRQAVDGIQTQLNQAAIELSLEDYLSYTKSVVASIDEISVYFAKYLESLTSRPKKKSSVKKHSKYVAEIFKKIKNKLENGKDNYISSLTKSLGNEIADNFQVSDLSQLVSFGEKEARIEVDEFVHIEFGKLGVSFSLQHDFINTVSSLSRVVFFESPAYWKVRDALKSAKELAAFPFFLRNKKKSKLIGVPKYFYDLDAALTEHAKKESLTEVEDLTAALEREIGGEFIFSRNELVFKDHHANREIPKNLISFGMTNLGMIHSLLKNNVITPGSFVFIDEPETNLHPTWQVLLMDVLVKLAERKVNIVLATHSIDMIKALEVGLSERSREDNDFISVHYFDIDGTLFEFESQSPSQQLIEAKDELSSSYEALFFRGKNSD